MIPNRHAMVGARPSAGFGLIAALTGNAGVAIPYPSMIQPGDLAILVKRGSAPGGSWGVASAIGGRTPGAYSATLSPSDLITPIVPNAKYNCLIYRGVTSIVERVVFGAQGPPGTSTRLGFTKDPNCVGRVALSAVEPAYFIPTVGTFTIQATQSDTGTHWNVWDNFNLDGPTIAAGVTVTWNPSDPSGCEWRMLELLK